MDFLFILCIQYSFFLYREWVIAILKSSFPTLFFFAVVSTFSYYCTYSSVLWFALPNSLGIMPWETRFYTVKSTVLFAVVRHTINIFHDNTFVLMRLVLYLVQEDENRIRAMMTQAPTRCGAPVPWQAMISRNILSGLRVVIVIESRTFSPLFLQI